MSSYIYNSLKEAVAFLLLLFQASFGIEDENVFGFWVSENGGLLWCHLNINTNILPRQARDKHRENTQLQDRFTSGLGETSYTTCVVVCSTQYFPVGKPYDRMPRQARDKSTQAPRKTATTNCRFSRARTHTHAQVGGRVSVSCSVGALPMALHFGYGAVEEFHTGLRQMDEHVLTAPLRENIPALMGTDGLKPKRCLSAFLLNVSC
jgi:hypothetical protein